MKEKLLAELKKKFAGQATAKFLEQLSERLIGKVVKDEDVEVVINELENSPISIADLQSEGDRRVTEAQVKWRKPNDPPTPDPPKPDPTETALEAQLKKLSEKLERLEKQEVSKSFHERLTAKMKEAKIPEGLAQGVSSDEDLETAFEAVKNRYEEIRSHMVKEGVIVAMPRQGDPVNEDTLTKSDIENLSKKF